ncbi:uncharacterized protein GGS22DRAFT_185256 [Annulohypoxylon maeteangense]|uniref:uncharacterized protein n=1 Tax=Annulohypoxylon maeteangense TaxID=1927788 RepID=UPI002007A44A|nr:uncharacterized protein GGS22DRAFT_185256 [Annulohypoxylon maeteangense]KAI0887875.1 hypothetical protein GGS22DRAFT_185256 [Annulohypoxylon maeteangense]
MIRGSGSWSIFAWIISFSILTTAFVVLRLWSAKIQKRKFYMDDGFVVAAYVSMLAQQGLGIWSLINGMGNHSTELSVDELRVQQKKVVVAVSTTWIFSATTIKLAVLAFYMRIFTTSSFKRWAISLMAISSFFGITFFVVFITHCNPISQGWNPVPWGSCRPLALSEYSSISLNLILDIMIIVLPMPWLWSLQMALFNKIVVMVMFSFGFATVATMCYRIEQTVHSDPDFMLGFARVGLLSDVEIWLGIIVACIPTLAPFFKKFIQPPLSKLFKKLHGSSSPSTKEGIRRGRPRTWGDSSGPSPKNQSNNSEFSKISTHPTSHGDEMRSIISNETPEFRAHCKFHNTNTAPESGGIYVQKEFHIFNA